MPFADLSFTISVGTFISVIIGFVANALKVRRAEQLIDTLRTNDMHDLVARLDRIETKLDQHLVSHAGR